MRLTTHIYLVLRFRMCETILQSHIYVYGVVLNQPFKDLHLFVQTHVRKQLEIHFMYLRNKEIYCILKTCCILCFILYYMPFISQFYLFLLKQFSHFYKLCSKISIPTLVGWRLSMGRTSGPNNTVISSWQKLGYDTIMWYQSSVGLCVCMTGCLIWVGSAPALYSVGPLRIFLVFPRLSHLMPS